MSDSLDGGLGHASDPGSIDGQAFGVEKTSTVVNGTANTKKNASSKATYIDESRHDYL